MNDIPYLHVDGFPFNGRTSPHKVHVLLSALDPKPEGVEALLGVLDAALAFEARYRAASDDVDRYDQLIRAYSPLEVERFRARHEEVMMRDREGFLPHRRPARRPNIFAPGGGGRSEADTDPGPMLVELAAARVAAAAEVRALRDGLEQQLLAEWLRALHEAVAILVQTGKARLGG